MADFLVQCPAGFDLTVTEAGLYPDSSAATSPVNADVYWRKADEPFVSNKHLGTFRVGTEVDFHLEFPSDTDVIFSTVTRGPRGQRMFVDPSEAPQFAARIPGSGGGGGTSIQIADEGVLLPVRGVLNFIGGAVTAADNSSSSRTDVSITAGFPNFANQDLGVPARSEINLPLPFLRADDAATQVDLSLRRTETGCYNAVLDCNCSADARYYKANWTASTNMVEIVPGFWDDPGTLALQPEAYWAVGTVHTFRVGQSVRLSGAGAGGADLFTTITNVAGAWLTLAVAPVSNGAPGLICHDETPAVQAALNLRERVHFPTGYYLIYSELRFPQTLSGAGHNLEIKGDGERASVFLISHDGHGFRMDQGFSGGGLVHLRMRDIGIFAVKRDNKDQLSSKFGGTNVGSGIAHTCTTISGTGVPEGDTTDFQIDRVFIQGFGRWGIFSQNSQTGRISNCTFWYQMSGGIALIGNNDTRGTSQKETNAIQITNSFIMFAPFIDDATRSGSGSIGARSRALSASLSFTSADVGKVVIIPGAGVGGRTHTTMIEAVGSSSAATISMPTNQAASGTVYLLPTNVANIYLRMANGVKIDGGTHQGNWGKPDFSAAVNEACGIRAEYCDSLRIASIWNEDVGGESGASISLGACTSTTISGYHGGGSKKSEPSLPSGHGVGLRLVGCECTEVSGTYLGQSGTGAPFEVKNFTKGTTVRACYGFNLDSANHNTDGTSEHIVFEDCGGSGGLSNQTRLLYDAYYGENYITNPAFIDRAAGAPAGWTVLDAAAVSFFPATEGGSPGRYAAYARINTQAQAAGTGDVLRQEITVPDDEPENSRWTLAFDAYMESRGVAGSIYDYVNVTGRFGDGSVRDSSQTFQISGDELYLFATGVHFRYQMQLRMPAGTSRVFRLNIEAARGPGAPVVRLSNFRLQPGLSASYSQDMPIGEKRGGKMRVPLQFATIDKTTTPAPAVGSGTGALAYDGTTLILGREGVWTATGGSGTELPDASPTVARGVVTNTAQAFGGYKTFAAGAALADGLDIYAPPSGLPPVSTVPAGSLRLAFNLADGMFWYGKNDYSAWQSLGVSQINGVQRQQINFTWTSDVIGTGPSISTTLEASPTVGRVNLNLPDATATVRGLVSPANQTWQGYKTFNSSLRADFIDFSLSSDTARIQFGNSASFRGFYYSSSDGQRDVVGVQHQTSFPAGGVVSWNSSLSRFEVTPPGSAFYQAIRKYDSGLGGYTLMPQRAYLTFDGPGVTVTDSAAVNSTIVTITGGSGSVVGTPQRFAMYQAGTGVLGNGRIEELDVGGGNFDLHMMQASLVLDYGKSCNIRYSTWTAGTPDRVCGVFAVVSDQLWLGPYANAAGATTGTAVTIRAGTGGGPKGWLTSAGETGRLTYNAPGGFNSGAAFYLTPAVTTDIGYFYRGLPGQTSYSFFAQSSAGTTQFTVSGEDGNLSHIRGLAYTWPTSGPTTGKRQYLSGLSSSAGQPAALTWADPPVNVYREGTSLYSEPALNFKAGSNITIATARGIAPSAVEVTISSTGASAAVPEPIAQSVTIASPNVNQSTLRVAAPNTLTAGYNPFEIYFGSAANAADMRFAVTRGGSVILAGGLLRSRWLMQPTAPGTYYLTEDYSFVILDTFYTGFMLQLPSVSWRGLDLIFVFNRRTGTGSTNSVVLLPTAGQVINGSLASLTVNPAQGFFKMIADDMSNSWWVI